MNRSRLTFLVVLIFAILVLGVAPFVGGDWIAPASILSRGDLQTRQIFWQMRVPRVCLGFLAGATLAVGGTAFQAMFRNPLATPYTLGIASGASLGAVLSIFFGLAGQLGIFSTPPLFAFLGAGGTLFVVYGLTRLRAELSVATMLLAGVAMSFFNSSVILILQCVSDPMRAFHAFRWMLGGLQATVGYGDLAVVLPPAVIGGGIIFLLRRELNLLSLGDEWASARGVSPATTKIALLFATGVMVAAVVAVCGPIGFVCLIAPHIMRLAVGPEHARLIPATALFGGAFLVVCDTFARSVVAPTEIPVGVITSLLGGPFFLWLLVTRPLSWEWIS